MSGPETTPAPPPPEPTGVPTNVAEAVLPAAESLPPPPETPPPTEDVLAFDLSPPPTRAAPPNPPLERPRPIQHKDRAPVRLVLTAAVGFLVLFLFLRTMAVEPFGVPTGSMAPNLIGNHRAGDCPRCGYPVRVGFPPGGVNVAEQYASVVCPNCGRRFSLAEARDLSGDRLLVDKNVFNLRKPRRWEMAVFRCPDTDPKEFGKPYVKRVIGLPHESLRIMDGDVYADGVLVRKELPDIRETRIPVFDMAHSPRPGGWNARWLLEPAENDPRLPTASDRGPAEADADVVHDGIVTLDAVTRSAACVRYRHWNLDDKREDAIRAWSSYDGPPRSSVPPPAVHDFSISCEIGVGAAAAEDGVFACSLTDGSDTVIAEIGVGPRASSRVTLLHAGHAALGTVRGVGLEPGHAYRLEFAFVDGRVSLAIDGKLAVPAADLPPKTQRPEVGEPLRLTARGCRIDISRLVLYRDIHYTQFGEHGTRRAAVMGPDEYFVLGDNSGNSQDSRKWPSPGVPEADFIGKPFLIHQPLRPARFAFGGQEQVFQTLDWSRLRWLH